MKILVMYDISTTEDKGKRLNRIRNICKQYGTHIQDSVFSCELNQKQLDELVDKLKESLEYDKDNILIFKVKDLIKLNNNVEKNYLTDLLIYI